MNRRQFPVVALMLTLVLALFGFSDTALAGPPNGVDLLRGRWDGTVVNLYGGDQSFTLLLDQFVAKPTDAHPTLTQAGGCIAVGKGAELTPVLASAEQGTVKGEFDLTVYGTVGERGSVIKLAGEANTSGAAVTDDTADGSWKTVDGEGVWSAKHHDRRQVKCPAVKLGENLRFDVDVYAAVGLFLDGNRYEVTTLESYSNIVSSAVRVDMPGGGSRVIPAYTDIFSPGADFVNEFRYLDNLNGALPVAGGRYTFTLLDVYGQPIPGAVASDVWTACAVDPPRDVSAVSQQDGIRVTWEPVHIAPGFDPGGNPPLGYYQIGLMSVESGEMPYGAAPMRTTSHLIPLASFGGFHEGADGFDFGKSLAELEDGDYWFEVIAFEQAPPEGPGKGLECQIRAVDEQFQFKLTGGNITNLQHP